jgi:uncharacterized protein YxjI
MQKLENIETLLVQQKKEWGEILTGFESRNKYAISSVSGIQLYRAEEKSSLILRWFLQVYRPLTIQIVSNQETHILDFHKPFRFFFHEMQISTPGHPVFGLVKQEFAIFSRRFAIVDSRGTLLYKIVGPFLKPWTFKILKDTREVGKISKKWTGLGKEMFTDADNFNVVFPSDIDIQQKSILLGALFLIDLLYFESSN